MWSCTDKTWSSISGQIIIITVIISIVIIIIILHDNDSLWLFSQDILVYRQQSEQRQQQGQLQLGSFVNCKTLCSFWLLNVLRQLKFIHKKRHCKQQSFWCSTIALKGGCSSCKLPHSCEIHSLSLLYTKPIHDPLSEPVVHGLVHYPLSKPGTQKSSALSIL